MKYLRSLEVSNFRSIEGPLNIPLSKSITMLVGPNNSGKTNILRILAIFMNQNGVGDLSGADFANLADQVCRCRLTLSRDYLFECFAHANGLIRRLKSIPDNENEFSVDFALKTNERQPINLEKLYDVIPSDYFDSHEFLTDFGSRASNASANVKTLAGRLGLETILAGSVYVPNLRFVSQPRIAIPRFSPASVPGETIALNEVVGQLQELDRPTENRERSRSQLRAICDFIKYCIECKSVSIEVPAKGTTILIDIDGNEQPLSNVGTGIEQLILIGLASFTFPQKLILIDEPELHFHPRSQKRMMQYLNENTDAKFVIATHSAAILDSVDSNIIRLSTDGKRCIGQVIGNNDDKFVAVRSLGHTPSELIQANFVIWVEGPSDRIYLQHWISEFAPDLVEGTDYTFAFYGGKLLAHYDFSDEESDLLKALSVARQFALLIDSDIKSEGGRVRKTKTRVKEQVEALRGMAWITKGREIENYIPLSIVEKLKAAVKGVSRPKDIYCQVVDAERVSKVRVSRLAVADKWNEWPLDLHPRMTELVGRIRAAG